MRKPGPTRHCRRDGDDLLVGVREFGQGLANDLRIGRRRRGRSFAAFDLVFAETVEFVGLFDGRLVPFPFLRENVQQHRLVLRFKNSKVRMNNGISCPSIGP